MIVVFLDGFVDGGFLQKEIKNMKMQGAHHIIRKPIHITDAHSTTSYETVIDNGLLCFLTFQIDRSV